MWSVNRGKQLQDGFFFFFAFSKFFFSFTPEDEGEEDASFMSSEHGGHGLSFELSLVPTFVLPSLAVTLVMPNKKN